MNAAFTTLIVVTLFAVMLSLGLSLQLEALRRCCQRPALPLRVLLGSCVLVPLTGLLLLQSPWRLEVSPPVRFAIALMTLCPSAPLAMRRARLAGADHQLAAVLQVGSALLAIVTLPLLAVVFRHRFGVDGWTVQPIDVALQVGRVQVLPLLIGVALRHWRPRLADRLQRPLDRLATVLLLLMVLVLLLRAGPLLLVFMPANLSGLLAMALLAVVAMLVGALMAGGHSEHRLTTTLVTAMRNPGLALLLAERYGGGLRGLNLAILLYALITFLLTQPLLRRRAPA